MVIPSFQLFTPNTWKSSLTSVSFIPYIYAISKACQSFKKVSRIWLTLITSTLTFLVKASLTWSSFHCFWLLSSPFYVQRSVIFLKHKSLFWFKSYNSFPLHSKKSLTLSLDLQSPIQPLTHTSLTSSFITLSHSRCSHHLKAFLMFLEHTK